MGGVDRKVKRKEEKKSKVEGCKRDKQTKQKK